jgi:hypothetical protein
MQEFGLIPGGNEKVDAGWIDEYLASCRAVMRDAMSVREVTKLVLIELNAGHSKGNRASSSNGK